MKVVSLLHTFKSMKTHRLGVQVALNFKIVQHIRDANLLKSFTQIFGCGCGFFSINKDSGIGVFSVSNFSDIFDKIIPLFEEYPLIGVKANDYEDFKKVAVLIKSKAHLTKEGLDQICLIKSGMNFKR
jgi:hypothetical protein